MNPTVEVKCVTGHVAKLYNGDSLEIAKHVGEVDAVITDPPYIIKHVGGGGCFQESNKKVFEADESGLGAIIDGYDIDAHMQIWAHALKAKNIVCFCSNDQVAETFQTMERFGYSPTIMVWHKHNACPMTNNTWIPDVEYFVVGRTKSDHPVRGNYMNNDVPTEMKSRVRRYPMCNERRWHPTAKPVNLVRELIEVLCPPNGTVLDPFGGSGSTAIAALKSGRNAIVCESNKVLPNCFDNMVAEIKREASQNRMF